jgi:tellurite resistance protein TerC
VVFYLALAVAFGIGVWLFAGGTYAGEFFAGYLTEYSLSVDNLFIFVIIMTAFRVPEEHQHRVLLVGVVIALVMRGIFIALGAAAISEFSWVFYLFAVVLLVTAYRLVREHSESEKEYKENRALKMLRRVLPVTDEYHGARTVVRINGKRWVTPMLIVMVAIGTTDLLFALDSIPAIFGLTQEPYLVFTANAFALMGLRQLYFLLGGLLSRLVYLSYGLSIILAFIGVKLILQASHKVIDSSVPEIGSLLSLAVIIVVLAGSVILSLLRPLPADDPMNEGETNEPVPTAATAATTKGL